MMRPDSEEPQLSDEALMAEYARRRRKVVPLAVATLVVAVLVGMLAYGHIRPAQALLAVAFGLCAVILVLIQLSRTTSAKSIRIARLNGERVNRIRSRALIFMAVILILLTAVVTAHSVSKIYYGGPGGVGWSSATSLIFFCAWALVILFGRDLPPPLRTAVDDELTVLNRNRAIQSGFFAFLVGTMALFVAAQISSRWALTGLPALLSLPLVVAIIRLVWLERSVGPDA
jgi:Ca2+/Na+ antiporter